MMGKLKHRKSTQRTLKELKEYLKTAKVYLYILDPINTYS